MNELIENLGYEVALKLCTVYGGCTVTIHRNFKRKINGSFQSIKSGKTPSNKSVSA